MRDLLQYVPLHVHRRRRGRKHGGDVGEGPRGPGPGDVLVLRGQEGRLVEGDGVGEEAGAGEVQRVVDDLDPDGKSDDCVVVR